MTELQKVEIETARFMRMNYRLDEVPGKFYEVDCLKFKQGKKTVLSINFREDCYEFQVILGKAEREKFENRREEFPASIQAMYDEAHTYHDGKWLLIPVRDLEMLEAVKKLILIKKNPNRQYKPDKSAVYSKCGHRCDLCVHYKALDEQLRTEMIPRLTYVYGVTDWTMRCGGCGQPDCYCVDTGCDQMRCASEKQLSRCTECPQYPCPTATVGYQELEARSISADDITLAVLPYLPMRRN
ncbi:MAG: DUF3788 family protein [Clostridia bacterium]|nr:DUF3788 family protein [Clostridia bacterium]